LEFAQHRFPFGRQADEILQARRGFPSAVAPGYHQRINGGSLARGGFAPAKVSQIRTT
jgi:hypothetical protein